jgi:hypothetical protein
LPPERGKVEGEEDKEWGGFLGGFFSLSSSLGICAGGGFQLAILPPGVRGRSWIKRDGKGREGKLSLPQ